MNTRSPKFSQREEDVIRLLMQGKSNAQIAYALGISVRTVEYHLGKVYDKLNVASRTEAILKLSKAGLWESTGINKDEPGESRVENEERIGDDDAKTDSSQSISMQTSTHSEGFNRYWAAAILALLLVIVGLIATGLWLFARGSLQFPGRNEVAAVTQSAPVGWDIEIVAGPELSLARIWHTATRLNDGRILLIGGDNGIHDFYARVEIYDPVSGSFSEMASLYTPRSGHTATLLLNGRVLVVGGYNAQQGWLEDAEVYDPLANTWTVVAPLHSHGVQHTATRLADGSVLVIGGCTASGICTNQVEFFDPSTDSWSEGTPLGTMAASHTAALLDDGRVLIAGGTLDGSRARLYDPQANTWTATGAMHSPHAQAAMIKLLDGRFLVAGGINVSQTPIALSTAEIFDPATNSWTLVASLTQPRYGHILALNPDGLVLAVGGAREYDHPDHPWTAESFSQAIEAYDPALNRWTTIAELPLPVVHATAVLLPDYRLWVAGGGAGHAVTKAWASTWVITPIISPP